MSILSTVFRAKKYIKQTDGYAPCSEWTQAEDVTLADGTTVEDKFNTVDTSIATLNSNLSKKHIFTFDINASVINSWGSLYFAYVDEQLSGISGNIKSAIVTYCGETNADTNPNSTAFASIEYISQTKVGFVILRGETATVTGKICLYVETV